jgi:hypothetical protein
MCQDDIARPAAMRCRADLFGNHLATVRAKNVPLTVAILVVSIR